MTDEDLITAAQADIAALEESGAGMPFVFSPSEAFMLLSLLQLVLRHSAVEDRSFLGLFAKNLALNIQNRLCLTPTLRELAERGWDKQHSVKP